MWFFLCCTCYAGLVIPPVTIRRHLRPGLASSFWIWSPIPSLMMFWIYWVCPTNPSCFQEGNPADGVFWWGNPTLQLQSRLDKKISNLYDLYIQLSLSKYYIYIIYKYIYIYIYYIIYIILYSIILHYIKLYYIKLHYITLYYIYIEYKYYIYYINIKKIYYIYI